MLIGNKIKIVCEVENNYNGGTDNFSNAYKTFQYLCGVELSPAEFKKGLVLIFRC